MNFLSLSTKETAPNGVVVKNSAMLKDSFTALFLNLLSKMSINVKFFNHSCPTITVAVARGLAAH